MKLSVPLTGLFAGKSQAMPNDGRPTGIFKQPVAGPVQVTVNGLEIDTQADRRVHGGPEKALHQFSIENYALLASQLPELADAFVPGSIGENFSTPELHERHVRIGDVFALGSTRIQIAQPRTPCWKIDAKFGVEGITERVAHFGIAGWYYRVLQVGQVQLGDELTLIDRDPEALSLEQFHQLTSAHRPSPESLEQAAAMPALNPDWSERLKRRAQVLRSLASGPRGPIPD